MQTANKRRAPARLKAKLAMAGFVMVAAGSLTLTSAGLLHVARQSVALGQGSTAAVVAPGPLQTLGVVR